MVSTSTLASRFTLLIFVLPSLVAALPYHATTQSVQKRSGFSLPIERRRIARSGLQTRADGLVGTVGLGDPLDDKVYTITVQAGNVQTFVQLDTGSSDLWMISDACQTDFCKASSAPVYKASSGQSTGAGVRLFYGDSSSGTHAFGPIVLDTVAIAGFSLPDQPLAAINDTNLKTGIFGLGFPALGDIQQAVVNQKFNTPSTTDAFVQSTDTLGPLVSRLVAAGHVAQPMFAITLQRDTVDVGGKGQITIGELPAGIDNSSITWVPVRLYSPAEGGQNPPTFAPNEVYPFRWEVVMDGVYLDGQQLPDTELKGTSSQLIALIDTGNSIIRGPQDVVNTILSSVSPAFARNFAAAPTYPCSTPHSLAFKIGGKMFPVDPRDFLSSTSALDANTCIATNIVSTDPPSPGELASWSLGDTFLKSNAVVFYYGNLTHPSVDPPRIGFVSQVPQNADALLQQAVQEAQLNGGVFKSILEAAPTASTLINLLAASTSTSQSTATPVASSKPSTPSQSASNAPEPSPGTTNDKKNGALSLPLSSSHVTVSLAVVPLLSLLSSLL